MKIVSILFLMIVISYGVVSAEVINIPNDYPSIQQGIDATDSGDTVLVDQGLYFENVNFKGKGIFVTSNYTFT